MIYKKRSSNYCLDILLLTYNCLSNTRRCIKALYDYTKDFNLTILDNGSDDGTINYLIALSLCNYNITLDLQKENLGIVRGRNMLYEISNKIIPSADYIMFIDNDQFVKKSWRDIYFSLMEEGYDIVGSEAWQMNDMRPSKKCTKSTDKYNYVGCGGMMIKKHVIKDIGLFDEQFSPMYFEDPNFCWEANEAGYKIAWVGNGVIHHDHKGSLLKEENIKHFNNSLRKFQKKWSGKDIPVLIN